MIAPVNGATPEAVTDDPDDREPGWSPDGSRIVFSTGPGGSSPIATVLANGTDRSDLTAGSDDAFPAWSPDGQRIVFAHAVVDGLTDHLATMPSGGGTPVDLTAGTAEHSDRQPDWQPDPAAGPARPAGPAAPAAPRSTTTPTADPGRAHLRGLSRVAASARRTNIRSIRPVAGYAATVAAAKGTTRGDESTASRITVRGAREHNLKNVDLELPRDRLIVFTGHLRLGQVVPRLRHHLRRRPAALRGVALGLRAPVPRPDGQARRRLHRGPLAGDLDRPEVGVAQPPLDGRDHHRGLRLPASPVRADRGAALPAAADGSSRGRRRSRSSTGCSSCPRARGSRCSRRWCAAARASTTGSSRSSPRKGSPGPASTATSTS